MWDQWKKFRNISFKTHSSGLTCLKNSLFKYQTHFEYFCYRSEWKTRFQSASMLYRMWMHTKFSESTDPLHEFSNELQNNQVSSNYNIMKDLKKYTIFTYDRWLNC